MLAKLIKIENSPSNSKTISKFPSSVSMNKINREKEMERVIYENHILLTKL